MASSRGWLACSPGLSTLFSLFLSPVHSLHSPSCSSLPGPSLCFSHASTLAPRSLLRFFSPSHLLPPLTRPPSTLEGQSAPTGAVLTLLSNPRVHTQTRQHSAVHAPTFFGLLPRSGTASPFGFPLLCPVQLPPFLCIPLLVLANDPRSSNELVQVAEKLTRGPCKTLNRRHCLSWNIHPPRSAGALHSARSLY